ncbi:MAG: hypothetical protein ACRCWW_08670 [Scandinavium sp.]|uniref:hypothetical protein n=1 Tax=Scandinavium sp. TaxID=2830653 RepID=UPI003F3CACA8
MNYSGNEELRQDIACLNNAAEALYKQCLALEKKYRWNSDDLLKALAGQLLRQATSQCHEIHRQIWEMDLIFSD